MDQQSGRQSNVKQPNWATKIRNKNKLGELYNIIKCNNIYIIGIPEENGIEAEKLFEERIAANFLN